MSNYIWLRPDLKVHVDVAAKMAATPVKYTCWADPVASVPVVLRRYENGEVMKEALNPVKVAHQWDSNLLDAEVNQNHTRCPFCGSSKISFKRLRPEGQ